MSLDVANQTESAHASFPFPDGPEWTERVRTPSSERCREMWALWEMPEHIQMHSLLVTRVALGIAEMVREKILPGLDIDQVLAAAMLHDVAKIYTIRHGGSHSQIGAAWVQERTGNPVVARAVLHHVDWPFAMDLQRYPVSLIVCYSDKRVRHTEIVTLDERFADLQERYGVNAKARHHIQQSLEQGRAIERLFSEGLKVELNAYSFDSRRMV
ncbi:HD domain-containing protein [Desulfonatronum sp. SC1]|uniref:HD domain-containing protein n=1 Tax=Desulfonatronum sp. SC1 TaxID=2109626 RepID=UPI000D30C1CF|nr:HD domain-containing protein [Desulfonatronum sp. SC1]PTN34391.1 phosphohydrolase [Desulfonatronum sp. SC1]